MKSSVIISSINRKQAMTRLFACLVSQTVRPDEIILIEAGDAIWEPDDCPPELRSGFRPFHAKKLSLAGARSLGQQHATGELLFFFDDDIILPDHYIEAARNHFTIYTDVMAVGGIYVDPVVSHRSGSSLLIGRLFGIYADGSSNRLLDSGWADYVRDDAACKITHAEWLFGCNFVIRASAFPALHFETGMEAWSFLEDVYLGQHLRQQFGDCMRLLPELKVIHDPPTSGGKISVATLRMRILYRFMLWRDYIAPVKHNTSIKFMLGMVANLLLMLKQERRYWVIPATLGSLLFIIKNSKMDWSAANEYVFKRN